MKKINKKIEIYRSRVMFIFLCCGATSKKTYIHRHNWRTCWKYNR